MAGHQTEPRMKLILLGLCGDLRLLKRPLLICCAQLESQCPFSGVFTAQINCSLPLRLPCHLSLSLSLSPSLFLFSFWRKWGEVRKKRSVAKLKHTCYISNSFPQVEVAEGRAAHNNGWNGKNGMASNTWKPSVWCIWNHSIYSAAAITTRPSSPIKVPPTSCYFLLWVCTQFIRLLIDRWQEELLLPARYCHFLRFMRKYCKIESLCQGRVSVKLLSCVCNREVPLPTESLHHFLWETNVEQWLCKIGEWMGFSGNSSVYTSFVEAEST